MGTARVIKRYTNRKLYDTEQSRYVTLDDIAKLIRSNQDVRVIDNETQDDLTAITFAQIILEEEKRKTNLVSVPFLRKLIHSGEAAVQDLSDSAKRALDQIGDFTGRAGGRVRDAVEEGGRALDDAIEDLLALPQRRLETLQDVARKQVDRIRQSPSLQREIERLENSIHSIEKMLTSLRETEEHESAAADLKMAEEGIILPADLPSEAEAVEETVDADDKPRASGGAPRS